MIYKKVPPLEDVYKQVDKSIAHDRRKWAQQERDELMGKKKVSFQLPNLPEHFWDVFFPLFFVGSGILGMVVLMLKCRGVI